MGIFANLREVIKGLKHTNRKEKTINVCPRCASPKISLSSDSDIYPRLYGITPQQYICSNCGYRGPLVLEKPVEEQKETKD
jgi:C4-type Zn-finger protein